MRMLDEFVERQRFGRILTHPCSEAGPLVSADRRQAEVFTRPHLVLVLSLVALVERAQRCDRRRRQTEALADIAQQLPWKGANVVLRVAAGPQKDQLNGGARATIAPETFVDRSYVAVVQREVALDVELRQSRG
ncbi:hypothetical protein WI91_06375 [Burkholderia vietnamiensis]|nr:hypothetical protein WI91_06375 [Burkholderia vietnamiensis]